MKIQLPGDLHIEFEGFSTRFEKANTIVFAGDIEVGVKGARRLEGQKTDKPGIDVSVYKGYQEDANE